MARSTIVAAGVCLLAISAVVAWQFRAEEESVKVADATPSPAAPLAGANASPIRLSRQARENLGLVAKPLEAKEFWRTIELQGVIVDRPGISDQGVVSPVTGVVTSINRFPGDSVQPGTPLFTIRLTSESLHASQMELFKATEEIAIAKRKLERLSEAAKSGALPGSRIIDIENEIERLNVAVTAYQQDLQARGLTEEDIAAAAGGRFVTETVVRTPSRTGTLSLDDTPRSPGEIVRPLMFEIQTLKVDLGQQVDAGQVLAELADHSELFVEGRAFKDDVPLIQQAAKNGSNVEVDFGIEGQTDWSAPPAALPIHHVASSADPDTRTYAFYLTLENQSQTYETPDGTVRTLWRFRPGGRMRLRVPVERMENVFIVPKEAVVQEGPDAFLFRQNGDLFERKPVHLLYEDRLYSVIANDGSVPPGVYVAQNGAASLNRILKAQSASGVPANVHVHADGTVHEAH
ncbi:MAG: HlyD family efflux transporter periplasmic adaptor subunit [Planctomycetaceae bacterium]|nr:HlyD family efflux transporter periplasmic adaptor subunit [Planctomycetaceae bacterium]